MLRTNLMVALLSALMSFLTPSAPVPAEDAQHAEDLRNVGVAKIDITPDYPVRLSGFGFRRTESEGVRQQIWAKALAISSDADRPAVLIAVDNLGIPANIVAEVATRLKTKAGLDPDRLAVTSTHTHTAPMLTNVCSTLFSMPIPPEHQEHIDRYTRELTDRLEQIALAALRDRQPARLEWGIGKVELAVNRRTKGGPVDHDLPVLVVRDPAGKIRAVYLSYACHCVTLSDNRISGDWAGFAQEQVERKYQGAVALVSIGCGADSNPRSGVTGDKGDVAEAQGIEIAAEVERLLRGPLRPVTGPLKVQIERIDLAFDKLPTREEYAEKAKAQDAIGYHARVQLARIDRGEALRTGIRYPIQAWSFGDSLAMVFLAGEVVVDYSSRLKNELDGRRLWINAYSNDAPCYIPSERILKEGGYEGGGAMVYYDQPTKLASGLEQKIVEVAARQAGATFRPPVDPAHTQGARPLAPEQSLAAIRTKPGLAVELVAAEPLVASPVAIDFGPDGKLWVAEMTDYPLGLDGRYQPGGRVRLVESSNNDGHFDKATVFLEGIPFPTGITVWRKGLLVCAAPDILYAEDTNGDGKADIVRKLFSGFGTDNFQARVNSLEYGLDGWVYGSCGLFGGRITNDAGKPAVALGDRDFRIKPDEGIIEPASGRTQQGRACDDWDNWFGCDNSNLCRHYPLADQYLRRNPHFAPEVTSVNVPDRADANQLFPLKAQLQLFKLSGPPGRATAACGLGIYRDELLGAEYRGDAFTCEPVNLLVHREHLVSKGFSFAGRRAADEAASEFLASSDNWFRPVQAKTGPDGALWIVDMYRYVIEHPRWIPPEQLEKIDVRAGHDMGRIYRVRPSAAKPRPRMRLDLLDVPQLVLALDSPNGWQRDMATQMLVWKNNAGAIGPLSELAKSAKRPEGRLAALCALDGLGGLKSGVVGEALKDSHPGVRRHAIRLAEKFLDSDPEIGPALLARLNDADLQIRLQLACSLGAWTDPRAGEALASLLALNADDPILTAAVLSSLRKENVAVVIATLLKQRRPDDLPERVLVQLFGIVAALGDESTLRNVVQTVAAPQGDGYGDWQFVALAGILEAGQHKGASPASAGSPNAIAGAAANLLEAARAAAEDDNAAAQRRIAAVRLLARDSGRRDWLLEFLPRLLTPDAPAELQTAAIRGLGQIPEPAAAEALTTNWRSYTPALKSQVIDLLLSREGWQSHLLKSVPAAEIDATRRQRLLASRNAEIKRLAAERFSGAPSADRKQVLEAYRDVATLRGERERGKAVFIKTCSVCHELDEIGHEVGPDLAAVANKTPQYLLQEILDPNRNVDSRYVAYTALTKEGRSISGLLASETAGSITLKGQEGKQEVVLRSDLEELQSSAMSLMPVGLEKDLSKEQLADLIAYLAATGPLPKKFPGNAPALVYPAGGVLALLATSAEIYGDQIVFESPFRNIGYWHGVSDHVVWTIELEQPGRFDIWLDWACDDSVAGNRFVLAAGAEELRGAVSGTGGWDRYRQAKIGTLALPAGALRLSLRPEGPGVTGALMDLRAIHLAPAGKTPVFAAAEPGFSASKSADDPATIAARILEDSRPEKEREALIRAHLDRAAELVSAMTEDLPPEAKEEYRRIPWIWRVAIAAGKKNETQPLRKLLAVALPGPDQPLRDWQAVVIGGGIINGISQQNAWPGERMHELLKDQPDLAQRWQRTLVQAAAMADNEQVPTGTRYDALRIIPLAGWKISGEQLTKYLKPGVHDELQMGAVSGSSDLDVPETARLLADGLAHFNAENRSLAIDALLRTDERRALLIEALEQQRLKSGALNTMQVQALRSLKDDKLRARAEKALK